MRTKTTYPEKIKAIIINEVRSGVDYKIVANKYGVPRGTIHSWCFDKRRSSSNKTTITKTDELLQKILTQLISMEAYLDMLLESKSQKEQSV